MQRAADELLLIHVGSSSIVGRLFPSYMAFKSRNAYASYGWELDLGYASVVDSGGDGIND